MRRVHKAQRIRRLEAMRENFVSVLLPTRVRVTNPATCGWYRKRSHCHIRLRSLSPPMYEEWAWKQVCREINRNLPGHLVERWY